MKIKVVCAAVNPKKRKGQFLPIEEILSRAHPELKAGNFEKICAAWKTVVSKNIYETTMPFQLKNSTLIVHVQSHGWLQELSFHKQKIHALLEQKIPDLKLRSIHFRIGRVERDNRRKHVSFPLPLKPVEKQNLPENIARSLATIRDEKIRTELQQLISISLAQKL